MASLSDTHSTVRQFLETQQGGRPVVCPSCNTGVSLITASQCVQCKELSHTWCTYDLEGKQKQQIQDMLSPGRCVRCADIDHEL